SGGGTTLAPIDMANIDLSGTASSNITISGNLDSREGTTTVPAAPQTFDEIGASASFSSQYTAFDSLGVGHSMTLAYFKTDANTWTVQAYIDSSEVGGTAGIPTQVGGDATLTFSTSGVIEEANAAAAVITGTPAYSNGAAAGDFTIDLSNSSQFGGTSTVRAIDQDGEGTGDITGYEIRQNGDIVALLAGGTEIEVGTIPLADFNNVEGLQRSGNGIYLETERSGQASIGTAGTLGFGELRSSSLELSNVDIANEFVDLVVYQRGYQASSQVFNATSEILRDTIGLIR
ncbi:MAG: flagellar hook-basal body complex protein, partial [Bdellovibrionales bacterium]|nr:flagellar hook-basal body complex protein [Bdellovibrionales bacterium]